MGAKANYPSFFFSFFLFCVVGEGGRKRVDQIGDQFERFGDRIGALTEQFPTLGVLTSVAIN